MNDSTASGYSSSGNQTAPPKSTAKKKRNLPGTPDPEAEVIALSPNTLLATNRFVCEICNKGFQRDQNLQLHRRGHNLPWKLRQRSSIEVKKKVYVCPEPGCIHHSPSRALGDLTGIKKHFCRKHGEKKWKCEKCSKNYAVQSDWKAHSKICGSREYKCDCGTLFLRRDSFITHRAFCDALSGECAKKNTALAPPNTDEDPKIQTVMPSTSALAVAAPSSPPLEQPLAPSPPPLLQASPSAPPSTAVVSSVLPRQNLDSPESTSHNPTTTRIFEEAPSVSGSPANCSSNGLSSSNGSTSSNVLASLFASSTSSRSLQPQTPRFPNLFESMARSKQTSDIALCTSSEPISLCLSMNQGPSIFKTAGQECMQYTPPPQPAMSATALLQKAAQVGVAASNASVLRGLGLVSSVSPSSEHQRWGRQEIESEGASLVSGLGLGLGLACDGGSALTELMLGTPSVFGPKHATLDLLGLGMAANGGPSGGLSAIMKSINDDLDVAAAAAAFGGGEYSGQDMGRSS